MNGIPDNVEPRPLPDFARYNANEMEVEQKLTFPEWVSSEYGHHALFIKVSKVEFNYRRYLYSKYLGVQSEDNQQDER